MDVAGAERLRRRIEQQQHWQLADAVRDGRQPRVDPDRDELAGLGTGIRLYSERVTQEGIVHVCKRLVDGVWEPGTVEEPFDPSRERPALGEIAHVA